MFVPKRTTLKYSTPKPPKAKSIKSSEDDGERSHEHLNKAAKVTKRAYTTLYHNIEEEEEVEEEEEKERKIKLEENEVVYVKSVSSVSSSSFQPRKKARLEEQEVICDLYFLSFKLDYFILCIYFC